jgi:hypothetical protein
MTLDFDPRAWNLLAGLAVVAGCGGRTISGDGDSHDSTNDAETGVECLDNNDCPDGYYCHDGECEYIQYHDGHVPYYSCYTDSECGLLELCEQSYCQWVYNPPPCDFELPAAPAFEISEPVLALAFVDVDDDGAQELVVGTQLLLHVIDSSSPMPVSHLREIGSPDIDAMVGGAFDGTAGQDVILLYAGGLFLHGSDGLGNLLYAGTTLSPYPDTLGLEAGSFDDEALTDLLAWGASTTGVIYGTGGTLGLFGEAVTSASARDLGLPGNGFTLLRDNELLFIDVGGFIVGSTPLRGDSPHAQTSMNAQGEPLEVGSSGIGVGWTLIEVFHRSSGSMTTRWALTGLVSHMRSGDLDKLDETDELALIVDDALWLNVGGQCRLWITDGPGVEFAFGDHDGDGDDELAVGSGNTVSIIDVE